MPPQRVWLLSRFGLKTGIDFDHYGLNSPSILANKKGQPITNCNRRFLGGFINRIVLCTTYQKSRRIEMEQGGKNLIFIWGLNAQHENEAIGKLPPVQGDKSYCEA